MKLKKHILNPKFKLSNLSPEILFADNEHKLISLDLKYKDLLSHIIKKYLAYLMTVEDSNDDIEIESADITN
jgi:hypothetical protein